MRVEGVRRRENRCAIMSVAATRERPATWHSERKFAMRRDRITPGFCVCGHQGRSHADERGQCRKCECQNHARPICKVDGCESDTIGLHYCNRHLLRSQRHGDPLAGKPFKSWTDSERFWKRVNKTETCWLWTGAPDNHLGYARFKIRDASGNRDAVMVHRFAYEELVGPIPQGLEIDHLCRIRNCVNPAHLDPVTHQENTRRANCRTHCKYGHRIPESRVCRDCANARNAAYRARKASLR